MSRFVPILDVQAPLPPLGAWLLFVDGMLPPNGSSQQVASVFGTVSDVAAGPSGGGNIGVAFQKVQQLFNRPDIQQQLQQAQQATRVMAVMDGSSLTIEVPQPQWVHEGHGGLGAQTVIDATVRPYAPGSVYTGRPTTEPCTQITALPVTWTYGDVVTQHGTATTASGSTSPTDSRGVARLTYTPRQEEANGHGYVVRRATTISASMSKLDLINALCGPQPAALAKLVRHDSTMMSASTQLGSPGTSGTWCGSR